MAIKEDMMCFYDSYDDYAAAKPCATITLLMVSLKVASRADARAVMILVC